MGTNYYVYAPATCDNPDHLEQLHIGKSSMGWVFSFHAIEERGLTSWKAWQEFLVAAEADGRRIIDEYGHERTFTEFAEFVEAKQRNEDRDVHNPNLKHSIFMRQHHPDDPLTEGEYEDAEGYQMSRAEFC